MALGGQYNISEFNVFVPNDMGAVYFDQVSATDIQINSVLCVGWKQG